MTKIYFAGGESKEKFDLLYKHGIRRILFSFYSLKEKNFNPKDTEVFMDSGGFSARTRGVKIDINKYGEFLKRHPEIKVYANLDTSDVKETLDNQETLEKLGLKPIPVFHFSDAISENRYLLNEYCQSNDYVAIGGVSRVIKKRRDKVRYLNWCFNIAKQRNVKLHGFGITDPQLLKMFPFYSVDSTSWVSGEKFGHLYMFHGSKMRIIGINNQKQTRRQGDFLDRFNLVQWIKFAKYMEEKKV